ncbi:MAG TPA: CvpA family protein [Thermoguttaceae bacterium]|nr:CvpA family protein [Thermoguttaceae bacterium]
MLTFVLIVVFMACVGFLYTEGMWGNALRLINVVTAALLATNFWEPVAGFLEGSISKPFSYFWDFIALWGLFIFFLLIFRLATKSASKVDVKFLGLANRIGGAVFAVVIGWFMVSFVLMSLHTAPLKEKFLFGGFDAEKKMFLGMKPDRFWLSYMEWMSKGPFSRSTPRVFDSEHEFIPKYAARRAAWHEHQSASSKGVFGILVPAGEVPTRTGGGSGGGESASDEAIDGEAIESEPANGESSGSESSENP